VSGAVRLRPGAWPAEGMAPEAARALVERAPARADEVERMGAAMRRLSWFGAGMLALMGVAGLAAGVAVLLSTEPPRHHFSLINPVTGEVSPAMPAVDAPRHFTTDTEKEYVRRFVETCAGYVHDLRARMYARCTGLMTPAMQAKYRDGFTSTNPNSPQNTYGAAATLIPEGLRLHERPGGGRVKSWLVRYKQAEYRNGRKVREVPWSTTIDFEWRPDLRMTEEQRAWNTAGMRVSHFEFGPDQ
jgi:type IV secretory pathway component VirB8